MSKEELTPAQAKSRLEEIYGLELIRAIASGNKFKILYWRLKLIRLSK